MEEYGVMTFESTNQAIKTEDIFKNSEIKFKTIPTPREISHSCGLAIRFDTENLEEVKEMLLLKKVAYDGVHKLTKEDGKYSAEKLF